MSKIKVGSKVLIIEGAGKDHIGTVMSLSDRDFPSMVFINTDKPNSYNHNDYNGYGILKKLKHLSLLTTAGKWTPNEIDYLHCHYRRKSVQEIANYLGRTYMATQNKASREGIHKHPRREYNYRDCLFIQHSYMDQMPIVRIGSQLHRSKLSIVGRLDLMKSRGQLPTIPEEITTKGITS